VRPVNRPNVHLSAAGEGGSKPTNPNPQAENEEKSVKNEFVIFYWKSCAWRNFCLQKSELVKVCVPHRNI
ncbi:hypothetical protein, partial [Marivita sp. S2033]|uniref:hypothetical protein n=1 Tax=Marivita sp. S2033 TaxID=3373187 RepID=UPI003981EB66